MTVAGVLLILAVGWLAYANGANDNFKGVATLLGSRTTGYTRALAFATAATFLGSVTAFFFGEALIHAFSGKGLVGSQALAEPGFLLAVSIGAAGTVLLATLLGFPISTTHAIVGALVGAGCLAPGGVVVAKLAGTFLVPLLLTPFIAIVATAGLYVVFHRMRLAVGVVRETCICVGESCEAVANETPPVTMRAVTTDGRTELVTPAGQVIRRLELIVDTEAHCIQRYQGQVVGLRAQTLLDALHYFTAGAVSFARGLQDTSKIVGLLVGASLISADSSGGLVLGVLLVGSMMALGAALSARKVAHTMSREITEMNHGQGFTGNLVTSLLVIVAGNYGLPASTTHCSVGSLFGIGAVTGYAKWRTIANILAVWLITLPLAAAMAAAVYLLISSA